ncbi:MAG: hypothetical protein H0T42_06555 [Deltaproteobacteria bacterium]|nr:hypothetical protein [Deltaproteobacteria bacterium]
MKHVIASVLLVAMTATAAADPHKILVLQTEGRADAKTRKKIDAALVKLATTKGAEVSPGEITFTDAAAAVGCKPEIPACRDEVLDMLTVDEVVYATTARKPGGTEIEVHRVTRGGMTREAKMVLATGQPADNLENLAPLFSDGKPPEPVVPPPPPTPTPPPEEPAPPPREALPATAEPQPSPIATPAPMYPERVDQPPVARRSRLPIAGMIGGGVSMTIGFLLWGEAGTIQEEVDTHPTATIGQLEDLKLLEERGDSYAGWGNLLFLTGMALGAVSTYFYIRGRRSRSALQSARIAPAIFDDGAGITLTLGGSP